AGAPSDRLWGAASTGRSWHPARRRRIEAETVPPPPRTAVSGHAPGSPAIGAEPWGRRPAVLCDRDGAAWRGGPGDGREPRRGARDRARPRRRRGAILSVSSAASVMAVPGLLVYGVSKAGLERLTTGVAEDVRAHGVAVNCFRIDVPIASEGFAYNGPELDKSDWEPTEVGGEGALWMLAQPPEFTGQVLGITDLRRRHGVAQSRVQR